MQMISKTALSLLVILMIGLGLDVEASSCRSFLNKTRNDYDSRELWLAFFRKTSSHSDYKFISDLVMKKMTTTERMEAVAEAKDYREKLYQNLIKQGKDSQSARKLVQTAYSRQLMSSLFQIESEIKNLSDAEIGSKNVTVLRGESDTSIDLHRLLKMVEAVERTWPTLIRKTRAEEGGSRLSNKHPQFFAGGRFKESYYWDSYFGSLGLMISGREHLVKGQLDNFLDQIEEHGLIPNGSRTYYLSRSQPPVISMFAKLLKNGADPAYSSRLVRLLEKDYNDFWMARRFDSEYGLNFHSDDHNLPRPERHSNDDDSALGESYRDVRAEAESGQDFTAAFMGRASKVLPVQLNAFLYKYETDLSDYLRVESERLRSSDKERAHEKMAKSDFYLRRAQLRKLSMTKTLVAEDGLFRNFDTVTRTHTEVLSGDVFSLLFVGALSDEQVETMLPTLLSKLEAPGGLRASTDVTSGKQWDGSHGWAPFQIMAVAGLDRYGYKKEAKRIAENWIRTNLNVFEDYSSFYEKVDVDSMGLPKSDGHKYPNQTGFLWTNSSILWMINYLGYDLRFENKL